MPPTYSRTFIAFATARGRSLGPLDDNGELCFVARPHVRVCGSLTLHFVEDAKPPDVKTVSLTLKSSTPASSSKMCDESKSPQRGERD